MKRLMQAALAAMLAATAMAGPAAAQRLDDGSDFSTWTPGGERPGRDRPQRGLAEVTVTPGSSINKAVERLRPGGTLILGPGIYSEDVLIEKAVNIVGASGAAKSEIRPSATGACLYVAPDVIGAVTVRNVVFRVTELYGSVPCVVVDGGVVSLKNAHVIARDNVPGIMLRGGIAHIENSTVEGGRFGILVEAPAPGIGDFYVIGNTITRNQTGLRVQGPGSVNAIANAITGNGQDGVVIFGGGGSFIANEITGNQANGVVLNEGVRNPRFVSNRIEANALAGIYVPLGGAAQLSRNEILRNGGKGYRCEQTPCPPIAGNVVDENAGDAPRRRSGLFD